MFNDFFRKSCCLWDNVEKYGGLGGGGPNCVHNMAHASCILNKQGYMYARIRPRTCTHTQTCNIYYFSNATDDSPTRLNGTLYVHCLYCYL